MKKVFLYYAEEDIGLVDEFKPHLAQLSDSGLIQVMDCADTGLGVDETDAMLTNVEASEIILLCMSVSLLGQERYKNHIFPKVLARYAKGECLIVPILFKTFLFKISQLANLAPAPGSGTAIEKFPIRNDGFTQVCEELLNLIECLDQHLLAQKQSPELEGIKKAIEAFNFKDQIDNAAPAAMDHTAPFSVLLLKGKERSGHDLLGWRWRKKHLPESDAAEVFTIGLKSTPESPNQIAPQLWNKLHNGMDYTGKIEDIWQPLAMKLRQDLTLFPVVIRLDQFEPTLHSAPVEAFFNALETALSEVKQQPNAPKAVHPLWFYVFYRFAEAEMAFQLKTPVCVQLPAMQPVTKDDFTTWKQGIDVKTFKVLDTSLTAAYNKDNIITPDADQNEVMDVIERICNAVYAKEDLYDKYIATKK